MKKIGVLTGGGDCPGLNAVIRAVVKTAEYQYGWKALGIKDGFEGLLKPGKAQWLNVDNVCDIISKGGTILGTTNRSNPFSYPVKKGKKMELKDCSKRALKTIKENDLHCLIVIGGDGTLKIALEFYELGVPVIGVPKTIDNDLLATEVTFGFDSAVNTAMEAIDKLWCTAESHHRVMVVEVMGRDAGWIALEAGTSGGADAILIPEIPFDMDKIIEKALKLHKKGRRSSIIVVAEGAYPKGGSKIYKISPEKIALGRLGGISYEVAAQISKATGFETRVTVLGHIQRGGSPTADDRNLGTRFGAKAVRLAAEGKFGTMACLIADRIEYVQLSEAVSRMKSVPLDHDLLISARNIGICFGD